MIEGYGPVTQALLGTLLTWGVTALGAICVVPLPYVASTPEAQRKLLDGALVRQTLRVLRRVALLLPDSLVCALVRALRRV